MQYILIEFDDGQQGYQEVSAGAVLRLTDIDGNTLPLMGRGSRVIDASPATPVWALPDPVQEAPPPEPPPPATTISVLAFRSRFSMDEKRAIYTAAKTVVDIQIWLDDLNSVQNGEVVLDDPRIADGVYGLESALLLAPGRAAEILNA